MNTAATVAERTPIATFGDILNAMAQNPELKEQMRQHLQDEELRNLPQTVARLAETVAELTAIVRGIETDVAEIKAGQARHDADIAEIKAGQARHDADIAELKAGQARLETGQARHDADIAELKAGQTRLEAGQARHDADIAELKAGQARLEAGQARHDADIAELKDGQTRIEIIQDDMRGQLVHLAARRMTGRIAKITQSRRPRWLESADIVDIADDADTDGIPANELDSFRDIDLALKAIDKTGADGQQQYIIIECSGTITHRDIARIARNAEYMTRFTDLPCQAVVIGYTIPNAVAEAARAQSVHWLLVTNRVTHPR